MSAKYAGRHLVIAAVHGECCAIPHVKIIHSRKANATDAIDEVWARLMDKGYDVGDLVVADDLPVDGTVADLEAQIRDERPAGWGERVSLAAPPRRR